MRMYFTYVLHSEDHNRIYIGQTDNLEARINRHNSGFVKSTKSDLPWKVIYFEKFEKRTEALKREKELKSHRGRDFIRQIILNGRVRQLPD